MEQEYFLCNVAGCLRTKKKVTNREKLPWQHGMNSLEEIFRKTLKCNHYCLKFSQNAHSFQHFPVSSRMQLQLLVSSQHSNSFQIQISLNLPVSNHAKWSDETNLLTKDPVNRSEKSLAALKKVLKIKRQYNYMFYVCILICRNIQEKVFK